MGHSDLWSDPVAVPVQARNPALFVFEPNSRRYAAAVFADGTYVGKAGLFGTAIASRPVKAGDRVLLFATGLGATNPPWEDGKVLSRALALAVPVTVRIGGVAADVEYAGLIAAGLYQINIRVPPLPAGDQPVTLEVANSSFTQPVLLTVAN